MKADFLVAGVNVGMVIQKKNARKCAFLDESLKIMGIKYI